MKRGTVAAIALIALSVAAAAMLYWPEIRRALGLDGSSDICEVIKTYHEANGLVDVECSLRRSGPAALTGVVTARTREAAPVVLRCDVEGYSETTGTFRWGCAP